MRSSLSLKHLPRMRRTLIDLQKEKGKLFFLILATMLGHEKTRNTLHNELFPASLMYPRPNFKFKHTSKKQMKNPFYEIKIWKWHKSFIPIARNLFGTETFFALGNSFDDVAWCASDEFFSCLTKYLDSIVSKLEFERTEFIIYFLQIKTKVRSGGERRHFQISVLCGQIEPFKVP